MARTVKPKFHASRAIRAQHTLESYKRLLGEAGPIACDTMRDLMQDTLHWMAQKNQATGDYPQPRATLNEACRDACRDFPRELAEGEPGPAGITGDLLSDLWWFIENVSDETLDRAERFFDLRARVRTRFQKGAL